MGVYWWTPLGRKTWWRPRYGIIPFTWVQPQEPPLISSNRMPSLDSDSRPERRENVSWCWASLSVGTGIGILDPFKITSDQRSMEQDTLPGVQQWVEWWWRAAHLGMLCRSPVASSAGSWIYPSNKRNLFGSAVWALEWIDTQDVSTENQLPCMSTTSHQITTHGGPWSLIL